MRQGRPYLLVVPSPPSVSIRSRHRAGCVWKQVLMELYSLVRDRQGVKEAQILSVPNPLPGLLSLFGAHGS